MPPLFNPPTLTALLVGPSASIAAVAAAPGWQVVYGFVWSTTRYPGATSVVLQAILALSTALLAGDIRLVRADTLAVVTGSTTSLAAGSTADQLVTSGNLVANLVNGVLYQVQVQATGGALPTDFVAPRSAGVIVTY